MISARGVVPQSVRIFLPMACKTTRITNINTIQTSQLLKPFELVCFVALCDYLRYSATMTLLVKVGAGRVASRLFQNPTLLILFLNLYQVLGGNAIQAARRLRRMCVADGLVKVKHPAHHSIARTASRGELTRSVRPQQTKMNRYYEKPAAKRDRLRAETHKRQDRQEMKQRLSWILWNLRNEKN